MQIDEVSSCHLDMRFVREVDIFFLEIDSELLFDPSAHIVLIEPAEYLGSFSFEGELERLPIELFLDVESFHEAQTSLIGSTFFLCFELLHAVWSDLFGELLRDEKIPSLSARDIDDFSTSPDIRDIDEEFYSDFCRRHIFVWLLYYSNI